MKAVLEAQPDKYDTSNLARLTCGVLHPGFHDALVLEEHGIEMIQGWGMTETNPLGTLSRKVAKRSHLKLSEDSSSKISLRLDSPVLDLKSKFSTRIGNRCP